jgi:predicted permease
VSLDTAAAGYTVQQLTALYRRISDELKSIPAVRSSGFAFLDAVGGGSTEFCCVAAQNPAPGAPQSSQVSFNITTAGYLEAAGMKLLAGRSFDENRPPEKRVAVLNQAMARKFFGSENPVGARLALGDPPKPPFDVEVIGVVNNARHSTLRDSELPMIYLPRQARFPFHLRFLYVGTAGDPGALSQAVIGRLRAIDPNIPIQGAVTIEQILDRELARETVITRLASAFGILALALTAIGLFGIMSYTVARRTSEIAVRIALGATPRRLLWLVVRSTLFLLAAGLSVGVLAAVGLARVVQSLLYGLTPTDPWMIAFTFGLLVATALAAAYTPLRRALTIPASTAFRQE